MKTPNAGIERFETKAPETWRPPARPTDPQRASKDKETLPPPPRVKPKAGCESAFPARVRETARPPVRRLRDTQRPGLRRPGESVQAPTLRMMENRRFPSRPAVAPAAMATWHAAATSHAPSSHAPSSHAPSTNPTPTTEHTVCAGCQAVTPTQRVSTLSSIGWRVEACTGQLPERSQRWFCPKCRARVSATDPPVNARKE